MILGRPVCYAYDDLQEYIKDRGFMFEDVTSVMPGFHAKSMQDIYDFICDTAQGKDNYKTVRQEFACKLNKYQDGHNAERLLDKLNL